MCAGLDSGFLTMKILVAVICCNYKESTLSECIEHIKKAGFEDILINFEGVPEGKYDVPYFQVWDWAGAGKHKREFDQDQQSRLTPICIARNMCMDYAQQLDVDWILFVDSDVMIPQDTKDWLFISASTKLRGGLVPGRGIHSSARYLFGEQENFGEWTKCEYATCGFMAIHNDLFWRLRFRWGKGIGTYTVCSEDPIFGHDARAIFNEWWWVNTSCVAKHYGDLKEGETSQF